MDLQRRMQENEEITNAGIRQAKRKIQMFQMKSQKSLEDMDYILKTLQTDVSDKIKKQAD